MEEEAYHLSSNFVRDDSPLERMEHISFVCVDSSVDINFQRLEYTSQYRHGINHAFPGIYKPPVFIEQVVSISEIRNEIKTYFPLY